jgi:hypothetical protein
MIKLLQDYENHKKDAIIDLGCVKNALLVSKKIAQWIKVNNTKYKTK